MTKQEAISKIEETGATALFARKAKNSNDIQVTVDWKDYMKTRNLEVVGVEVIIR